MMLQEWFDTFNCKNANDITRAKKEMVQCIVLAGLSRSDFFEHASFFGGTALRILYKLPRFSEDLDFSLKIPNDAFTLEKYFDYIQAECNMYNMNVSLNIKKKVNPNSVESAFLKEKTIWAELKIDDKAKTGIEPEIRIKFEIEKNPPLHAVSEQKIILRPFSFYVSAYKPEFLFAGKMHAVMYRQWRNRIKGRDWYDYEWYIKNDIPIHLAHFEERAKQSGSLISKTKLTPKKFLTLLKEKIDSIDVEASKDDIARFVFNPNDLNIWSKQYFLDLAEKIRFV
jgi:predicted nucleotidyltransferase component of viral defense system